MMTVIYDGSFEGWLTSVFEIYEYKYNEVHIIKEQYYRTSLIDKLHNVYTCEEKAQRVWKGFKQKFSPRLLQHLYHAWLSEQKGIEDVMFYYIKSSFTKRKAVGLSVSDGHLTTIQQLVKQVHREVYRVKSHVRFQQTADNLPYTFIDPAFNVLPLIVGYLKEKYEAHNWLVYDTFRKYGMYYDLQTVEMVQLAFADNPEDPGIIIQQEQETAYQKLWQKYFQSANVKARENITLHIQPMQSKYWKYLLEKKNFM
ncbi:TIGR03915 family putative DNA repair protein [Danxiaibacter flavus]|uniref:TIGR03915 family putative DNA repair protein n=1 Tax=Danxiaibacter flavus TaxID=3049108 RepID=A0ABV3ZB72_9BACT|nr:TIGR03915 family putative DNA repair protein [Chitinophagaceae bacterium DXS]